MRKIEKVKGNMISVNQISGNDMVSGQINTENIITEEIVTEQISPGIHKLFDYIPYILTGLCVVLFLIIVGLIICMSLIHVRVF